MHHRKRPRILLDAGESLSDLAQKPLSETRLLLSVPICRCVELALDIGAKDELHARRKRRAFTSSQGTPAPGFVRASRSLDSKSSLRSGVRVKSASGDACSQSVWARSNCSSRGSSKACRIRSALVMPLIVLHRAEILESDPGSRIGTTSAPPCGWHSVSLENRGHPCRPQTSTTAGGTPAFPWRGTSEEDARTSEGSFAALPCLRQRTDGQDLIRVETFNV